MRKFAMIAAAAAVLATPVASKAQVTLGLRAGYGWAMGDAGKFDGVTGKMSDGVSGQIPLQLDALWRLNPQVGLGAYVGYGFAQFGGTLKDTCNISGVSCDASIITAGLQGTYAFSTGGQFVPWLGLATGWEWGSITAKGGGSKAEQSISGWDILTLQVGGDYKVNPKFGVGPYLTYGFGQYSSYSAKFNGTDTGTVFGSATHQWFQLGLRGTFEL
jgi:hypothetical protein